MTEKELLKLKKSELLEIMLAQSKEIDSLREQLAEAEEKLASRKIAIKESGSIAEASLKLTKIFEEAQKAADLYVDNVKRRARMEEKKARQKAEEGAGGAAAEAGAVAAENLHIVGLGSLEGGRVRIDDRDIVPFVIQLFHQRHTHLAAAYHNNVHCTSPGVQSFL